MRSSAAGPDPPLGDARREDPAARGEGFGIAGHSHDVRISRHDPEAANLIGVRNRAMGAHVPVEILEARSYSGLNGLSGRANVAASKPPSVLSKASSPISHFVNEYSRTMSSAADRHAVTSPIPLPPMIGTAFP